MVSLRPLASSRIVGIIVGTGTKTNEVHTNMALTELAVRSAKAEAKITKLSDGGGLQLWVTPDGAKRWRLAYRFAGGQKVLAIGVYPTIGLKEARLAREDAKKLLATRVDPSAAKKRERLRRPIRPQTHSRPSRPNCSKRSGARARRRTPLQRPNGCSVSPIQSSGRGR